MENTYEDIKKSFRGLLEELNLNEKIQTELLNFILAGHSLERYGKISDQTKALIQLRIDSNEFIKDTLIEIKKAKQDSKEKRPASIVDEEINEILVKLKVKDSTRESLLKEILDKGISSIETSDISPKTKTKLIEELSSRESLSKYLLFKDSTENKMKTLSKELIITILVESDIQDEENLYERISRSILNIGIDGLSEFEQDLSSTEMNSLKKKLEPFISTESIKSNLNEANNELPMNVNEFEDDLKNVYRINLSDLYQDYLSMPESAERIILKLLYEINSKLINSSESDETIETDLNDMKQQLDHLKQRLKVEELTYISVDHFFIHLRNGDWKALSEELSRILKQLRPLDIHEIQRLVNEAEICAEMIKDEDVVLFLGDTGAGKSTHIHFLAGSTMVQTRIKGLNHIMPTEIKNPALKKVSTSPFAKSETRFISAVPINISEMDGENDERLVLCDTPGFEDTSGAEVDIANGYSIVKAVKGCKSVRIVLLISYKSMGDKLTGVKNLAHILVQMVSGLKSHMKAFSYYFSKFPEQDRSTINAMLKDLKSKMNSELLDPSFKLFFDDMVYKTRNNKQISIDLINERPGKYLDDLWDGASICEPDEVFKVSITEKSKGVLKDQIRRHQLNIISALRRCEFDLVNFKLNQLKYLHDLLNQEFIGQVFAECLNLAKETLNQNYQVAITDFNRSFDINNNTFSEQDVVNYQISIENAKSAEYLREQNLGEHVIHVDSYIQNLKTQINSILLNLKEISIDDMTIKSILDRVKTISSHFPDTSDEYAAMCLVLQESFEKSVSSFKEDYLPNSDFTKCAEEFSKVNQASKLLKDHLDENMMEKTSQDMKKYFFDYLKHSAEREEILLSRPSLDVESIDSLDRFVSILEAAQSNYLLQAHISAKELKEIYNSFLKKLLNYYETKNKLINSQIEKKDWSENAEMLMEQLSLLRKISAVETKTNSTYSIMFERLCGSISESKREVDAILKLIYRHDESASYESLLSHIKQLKNVGWIDKYRNGLYSDLMCDIIKHINDHAENLKQTVLAANLELENYSNLKNVNEYILKINKMKILNIKTANGEYLIPGLDLILKETNKWFIDSVNQVLDMIKHLIEDNSTRMKENPDFMLDHRKIERSINYLESCREIAHLKKSNYAKIFSDLDTLLNIYRDMVIKELDESFRNIIYSEGKNYDEMSRYSQNLLNRLEEVNKIEMKHSLIFKYFTSKDEKWAKNQYWIRKLIEYHSILSEEMENICMTDQKEMLKAKIQISRVFSNLEGEFGILSESRFSELYKKFRVIFFDHTSDTSKGLINSVKNYDFEAAANLLIQLQTTNGENFPQKNQLKQILNNALNELFAVTKDKSIVLGFNYEIKSDEVKSIQNNLKKISEAKKFIPIEFYDPIEIDRAIEEIKFTIKEKMNKYLDSVEALIKNNNFQEANAKIESISLARTILGIYCMPEMTQRIEQIKENEKEMLYKVVKKYNDLDLTQFTLNPPTDIFAKFEKVTSVNSVYSEAEYEIKEKIFEKFRKELELARQYQPADVENKHIRRFESAVKFLPKNMKEALELELGNFYGFKKRLKFEGKTDITLDKTHADTNLNNALETNNFAEIKAIYDECKKTTNHESLKKIRNSIEVKVKETKTEIEQQLERNNIKEALENYKTLNVFREDLSGSFKEINNHFTTVKVKVEKKFNEIYNIFSRFSSTHLCIFTINDEMEIDVQTSFNNLIAFSKLKFELTDEGVFKELMSNNVVRKISEMHKNIFNLMKEINSDYETGFKKRDMQGIKKSIEFFRRWSNLIKKIRSYAEMYSEYDIDLKSILNLLSQAKSYETRKEEITKMLCKTKDDFINVSFINSETEKFDSERDTFFEKISCDLDILLQVKCLEAYQLKINLSSFEESCLKTLQTEIKNILSETERLVEKLIKEEPFSINDASKLSTFYSNLNSIKKHIKYSHIADTNLKEKLEEFDSKIIELMNRYMIKIQVDKSLKNVSDYLIHMKTVSNNLVCFKERIDKMMDQALLDFKQNNGGPNAINKLGVLFKQNPTGQMIVSEHQCFKGYSLSVFNSKTKKHDIAYVIDKLDGDSLDKNRLRKRYDKFEKEYTCLINKYLMPDADLQPLISATLLLFSSNNSKQDLKESVWDSNVKSLLPIAIAHVSALVTLNRAENYFEADENDDKQNYLFQPHPAQIVSIFRILGVGDSDPEQLQNNLVQIGTGEGKSVTLAIVASVFALLGFDVSCACYSEYLSQRDYKEFQPLFDMLNITAQIRYGTFNKLCENVINQYGDIRKLVEAMISTNATVPTAAQSVHTNRPKILLIDEVDVFFSKEFYGNVYTPSTVLRDLTITALINFIWESRANLTYKLVLDSTEYKACCQRYANWKPVIDEAVKNMLYDIKNFESHDYIIKDDKIGYKEQDNIVFNSVYGYKTLFAYYSGYEKIKITKKSLEENIGILVKSGSFSYADVPQEFSYILGVTGTLKSLSEPEKYVVENDYNIKKKTYAPSVFGANNLKFSLNNDIHIENVNDYLSVIEREMNSKLCPNGPKGAKRAVLVFFESEEKLEDFYGKLKNKSDVIRLTEKASILEKESLIKRATSAGQITLLTKLLGRGTDFVCHDETVINQGGIHVIQTFLSEELSEEVQIKGRSARQGDPGSYAMILLDQSLEKFLITLEDLENVKNGKSIFVRIWDKVKTLGHHKNLTMYELLSEKRDYSFKTSYEDNKKYVVSARQNHKNAIEFLNNILANRQIEAKNFLVRENKGPEPETCGTSRTICLMDATGSMSHLLQKAKKTVDTMFQRCTQILEEKNFKANSFQLQFAVYRNYSSGHEYLLQSSPWETKPNSLRSFMNNINVNGGQGNEAIEIGLWHANNENEKEAISQIILIGDMPANSINDVKYNRQYFSEEYWSKTKFKNATHYKKELDKLKIKHIPIHAYYVCTAAKNNFEEISKETGGRCEFLDINSPKGAQQLTDLVTEEILRNVGGKTQGDSLVDEYRRKFGRSYI